MAGEGWGFFVCCFGVFFNTNYFFVFCCREQEWDKHGLFFSSERECTQTVKVVLFSLCGLHVQDGVHIPQWNSCYNGEGMTGKKVQPCFPPYCHYCTQKNKQVWTPLTWHLCVFKNRSDMFEVVHGVLADKPKFSIVIFISVLVSVQAMRKLTWKRKKTQLELAA